MARQGSEGADVALDGDPLLVEKPRREILKNSSTPWTASEAEPPRSLKKNRIEWAHESLMFQLAASSTDLGWLLGETHPTISTLNVSQTLPTLASLEGNSRSFVYKL
ncbi:predicted protein [Coccidioides posadasii str. Silveira]|uniref:Predicted protein n=2 Tax=Coccidioides posadasii TaxID=199306 RepID=E9DFL7_COCPS|nr:predicted protein [Coccidioides posadasii str. Silveira]KMM70543.1 hypothetical protein CPAG_06855 [Coccidioides posadasii RMSCC 3488]